MTGRHRNLSTPQRKEKRGGRRSHFWVRMISALVVNHMSGLKLFFLTHLFLNGPPLQIWRLDSTTQEKGEVHTKMSGRTLSPLSLKSTLESTYSRVYHHRPSQIQVSDPDRWWVKWVRLHQSLSRSWCQALPQNFSTIFCGARRPHPNTTTRSKTQSQGGSISWLDQ